MVLARILAIGEILWDCFPDGERIGGAPLNFAFHAARLGHSVALRSAVGRDARGDKALEFLRKSDVHTMLVQQADEAATGIVQVTLGEGGNATYALQRPAAYDAMELDEVQFLTLRMTAPEWIYFGTLLHKPKAALEATLRILAAMPSAKRFYDVNLREGEYSAETVRALAGVATILKLNEEEMPTVAKILGVTGSTTDLFLRAVAARYNYAAVCVTRGADGCVLFWDGSVSYVPGWPTRVTDTVGAGDAFAAALLHCYLQGDSARRAGIAANWLGSLVASLPGATPEWDKQAFFEQYARFSG